MAITPIRPHPNPKDSEQVEHLTSLGASRLFIANHLHLEIEQLEAAYPRELNTGVEEANIRVARKFFEMATDGHHPLMTVQWMKMRANWSEAQNIAQKTPEDEAEEKATAQEKLLKLLNRGK